MIVFAWFGGLKRVIAPEESEAARGSNFHLLSATENVLTSEEFKNFIDIKGNRKDKLEKLNEP